MSSDDIFSFLSHSQSLSYNKTLFQISQILSNLTKTHQLSSETHCFSLNYTSHSSYISCISDRFSSIEVNKKAFHSKQEYETLLLLQCLKQEAVFSPKVCLHDLENKIYKNLKDFSNIFK